MRLIPYSRQSISPADIRAVNAVLESDWITQGPKIGEFEKSLAAYTGARYAVAVSSGTAALHIACMAAGIRESDEVITSPVTFVASANSVLYCGGRPVFADVQPDTINIDPGEAKTRIRKKTKAIMPVHFAGHPCDMREIRALAARNGLVVIEDAAHALGAEYRQSKIGACKYSDMTIMSFHPVKGITTGEGGAVLTNKRDYYEKLLMLRTHGISRNRSRFVRPAAQSNGFWYYEMQCLGFNYRITDIQCALGISQINKLDKFLERRREIAAYYAERLSAIEGIKLPVERDYVRSARHIYCIRLNGPVERKRVFETLRRSGIGVQVHYLPVYLHPYYRKKFKYKTGLCPEAEDYYSRAITLPLYPDMTKKQIDKVIREVERAVRK